MSTRKTLSVGCDTDSNVLCVVKRSVKDNTPSVESAVWGCGDTIHLYRNVSLAPFMTLKYFPAIVFMSVPLILSGQVSRVLNASFEGEPRDATIPRGWLICTEGTTPDILPGPWGVYTEASHGETYVGLITRENGTWEAIGQKLTEKLQANQCYEMSLDVARSDTYADYNDPIRLRVWCGRSKCDRDQLILESDFIRNTEWQTLEWQFTPKSDMQYILLEAFYREGSFSHRGNILLDNISPILRCARS